MPFERAGVPVTGPSPNGSGLVAVPGDAAQVFTLTLDAPAVGAARLRLAGHLDGEAARDVLHAAADVVRCGCSRLVLDLDGLTSWDADATYAVVGCTRLARWLPQGVDVVGGKRLQRDLVPALTGRRGTASPGDTMAACHAS